MSSKKTTFTENAVLPAGFKAAGVSAGLKKRNWKDLALMVSEAPAVMAGAFTTNQVKAAPVKLCRKRLKGKDGRAIVVNSGNANACTGAQGLLDAEQMAQLTARALNLDERTVFVCSTGTIGVPLPMDIITRGIGKAVKQLAKDGGEDAAEAIMTTDTKVKHCTARFYVNDKSVTVTGIAKGSGMIEPNMATMLAFLFTDAMVEPEALQSCLTDAVNKSFNRITVDGDQSTNDTVLFMSNGIAGNRPLKRSHREWQSFTDAVHAVTMNLALKMVEDGEGATKVVTVKAHGARNDADADIAARSVSNSLLVKTSWVGECLNWGRIMDALGYSKAKVDEDRVDILYDNLSAVKNGIAEKTPAAKLKRIQQQKAFTIDIYLNLGSGEAVVYSCDCTEAYVKINK